MKGKELIGRALVAAGMTAGVGAALEGCTPQQQSQPAPITQEAQPVPAQEQPPSTPEARIVMPAVGRAIAQTVESVPAAVPSATPEPPKPTATPKPTPSPEPTATPIKEVKKEIPCVVLPDQFCSQGERAMVTLSSDAQREYVAFNKLPVGTPIYSPVDGFFAISREGGPQSPAVGFLVRTAKGGAIVEVNLRLENKIQRDVKAGELIGYTTGVKTLEEYDLLITIRRITNGSSVTDEDALRQLLPKAFEKPIIPAKQDSPLKPSVSAYYGSNPPR